jgi:hypothetical protein
MLPRGQQGILGGKLAKEIFLVAQSALAEQPSGAGGSDDAATAAAEEGDHPASGRATARSTCCWDSFFTVGSQFSGPIWRKTTIMQISNQQVIRYKLVIECGEW